MNADIRRIFRHLKKNHNKVRQMHSYEKYIFRSYLKTLLLDKRITHKMFSGLCDWLTDHLETVVETEINDAIWDLLDEFESATKDKILQKRFIAEMFQLLEEQEHNQQLQTSPVESNLRLLAETLQLDEVETDIFHLLARYKLFDELENLLDNVGGAGSSPIQTIAQLLGLEQAQVAKTLSLNNKLVSTGIIHLKSYSSKDLSDRFELTDTVAEALVKTSDNPDDIRVHILGQPLNAELAWDDFAHLKKLREKVSSFLQKSLQQKQRGINILLWGPPGTGKTEFCKTLAEQIDCSLFTIGETDNEGEEPSRRERLASLRLAQSLLHYESNNLLMFDEMDDLFERDSLAALFGGKFQFSSKVFTNRLFEDNPVPTIWIINDGNALDEAIVRRMSLVLEIKSPPKSSRREVWERILTKHDLNLSRQDVDELANLNPSPAVLDNAVRFACINGEGSDDILFASRGTVKAILGSIRPARSTSTRTYCPELVNADVDLDSLTSRLKTSAQRHFSLCLYGPPGTGKTEYVRHLADQLGMEVLVKRVSDLFGPYVGQTEKAIAWAFEEAQENKSFLVFDEADSLLGDRRKAHASWEISQVNEMLTWMESHQLPFACTTNLMEHLDQASLRRFTFKVECGYLDKPQIQSAARHFLGSELPFPSGGFDNIAPGDFSVVRRKAEILGVMDQPLELIRLLEMECTAKDGNSNKKIIGFTSN